jgi:hypothetical protein
VDTAMAAMASMDRLMRCSVFIVSLVLNRHELIN